MICGTIFALLLRWLATYAKGPLAVCIISFAVASMVQPMAVRLSKMLGISRRISAAVCVLFLFFVLGGVLTFGAIRLWREVRGAFFWLSEHWDHVVRELDRSVGVLLVGISQEGSVLVAGSLAGWLRTLLQDLGGVLASGVGGVLRATPRALMAVGVCLIACFYLSMDYGAVMEWAARLLPRAWRKRAAILRKRACVLLGGYARAYAILMGLTFFEVLIGMMILGQPYGFLIAVCVALIDVLPVLGVGIVLIPWGLFSLAAGRMALGIGLLILYAVITVVRQLVEPRLVGVSLGLHPLCSLLSMFAGLWCFGVWGMLCAPFAVRMIGEVRSVCGENEKNL